MKIILMLLLCSVLLAEPCLDKTELLEEKKIVLETKSLKGWVRFLKNREKHSEYGIWLSEQEVQELLDCLTAEIRFRASRGKMQ